MANADSTQFGTPGADTLTGSDFDRDYIDGGGGNDSISGLGLDDTLVGGFGNDTLLGGAGNDVLLGGWGADTLNGGPGNDTLDGGEIRDRTNLTDLNFTSFNSGATTGAVVNLQTGVAQDGQGGVDQLTNINFVQGTAFNDSLTGSNTFNLFEQFEGMAGNDTIDGGAIETVTGSNGNRVSYASATNPVFVNLATGTAQDGMGGTDTLLHINQVRGGSGNDTLIGSDATGYSEGFEGRGGNDSIVGGGGNDQARYDSATTGIVANLATGIVQDGQGSVDTLSGVEGIRGSNFADSITGSDTSGLANDFEFFTGNGGNDTIDGGGGFDRVDYNTALGPVQVTLGGAGDGSAADGQGGVDVLRHIEAVRGGDYNDQLQGSDVTSLETFDGRAGNDFIDGHGGPDRVDYSGDLAAVNVNFGLGLANDGFGGTDGLVNIERVRGSMHDDTIAGGSGNDTLEGNGGDDTLSGNGGNDTFLYFPNGTQGRDLITDFGAGDAIEVRATMPAGSVTAGNGSSVGNGNVQVLVGNGISTLFIGTDDVPGADVTIDLLGQYSVGGFAIANGASSGILTYAGAIVAGNSVTLSTGPDNFSGGRGNDSIDGAAGDDHLLGGDGRDTLIGGIGNDWLEGNAGSDTLIGGAGNDTLDGGVITDRVNYTDLNYTSYASGATSGATINLQTGSVSDGQGGTDTLVLGTINFVQGTAFNDSITGSNFFNLFEQFEGGAGNDTIDGGAIDVTGNNSNRVSYQNNVANGATAGINVDLASNTAADGFGTTDTLANITAIRGSGLNDTISGSNRTDFTENLDGGAGNDVLDGRGGLDQVRFDSATSGVNVNLATGTAQDGQGGTDTLANIEGVRGTDFADTMVGGNAASDNLEFFLGGGGNDTIDGGSGFDRVDYTTSNYGVYVQLGGAGTGNAQDGLGGSDTLLNIEGVRGSEHADVLRGSDIATLESFDGRGGNDTIDGAGGIDRVDYSSAWAGVQVDLGQNVALDGMGGVDTLYNIENIRGSGFDDTLVGNFQNNVVEGNAGNDVLDGGFGSDTLTGGAGIDQFVVSNGPGDIDRITDLQAGETVLLPNAQFGDLDQNFLQGGDPNTLQRGQLMVATPAGGVTRVFVGTNDNPGADLIVDVVGNVTANQLVATFDTLDRQMVMYRPAGVTLTGSAGDNLLTGSNFADSLVGGDGNDTLLGYQGNDFLSGGNGDDEFLGDLGTDTIDGGAGFDRVHYELRGAMTAGVSVDLNGAQSATSGGETDVLTSIEAVSGTRFNDTLQGSSDANELSGSDGDDRIFGQTTTGGALGAGYVGTSGNDTLSGGFGNDSLQGGTGNDFLLGGDQDHQGQNGGSDHFFFAASNNGVDTIGDFGSDDGIELSGVQITGVSVGNGSSVTAGQVQVQSGPGMTTLFIGTDGVAGADVVIQLQGNYNAGNFAFTNNAGGNSAHLAYQGGTPLDDFLNLGNGNDVVNGLDGNDTIFGNGGNDTLNGGNGDNLLDGGSGNDFIDGGANGQFGDRVQFLSATSGVNVNLATGSVSNDGTGGVDSISNVEHINGTPFDDTLVGSNVQNWFSPGAGNDSVDGGLGQDAVMYEDSSAGVTVNLQAATPGATGAAIGNDTLIGIEGVHGSSFADSITLANTSSAYVFGRAGNDTLIGGTFNDNFIGGSGNDSIVGGAGFDTADYSNDQFDALAPTNNGVNANLATGLVTDNWGNTDTLSGVELLRGSSHDDTLVGGNPANGSGATDGFEGFTGNAGNDLIDGGAGYDRAAYDNSPGAVNVTLGGTAPGQAFDGWGGVDTLINIEEVWGSSFNDVLTGSDSGGFESFEGRGGNDTINGMGGVDRVSYQNSTASVNVNLAAGSANDGWGGLDTLSNIENIRGSDFNDTLQGDAGNNDIEGRLGDDSLFGGAGQDSLHGNAGNDTLNGGAQVVAIGWDATANVSPQYDIAFYSDATRGINVDLGVDGTGGTAQDGLGGSDTLIDIEMVIGSNFNDVMRGTNRAFNEIFRGGAGDDTIFGGQATGVDAGNNFLDYRFAPGAVNVNLAAGTATGDGNDTFSGIRSLLLGAGNDTVVGDAADNYIDAGQGNDSVDGAAGNDIMSFLNATGSVVASLATGTSSGADGNDTFANMEGLRGSEFADTLTGGAGDDRIQGRAGNDSIDGGGGNDSLQGGFGDDTIAGGSGLDTAVYSAARSAYIVTRTATGYTVSGGGEGSDTLTSIERLKFADGTLSPAKAAADFNGDGVSDLLWHNNASGDNAIWRGADVAQSQAVPPLSDSHWMVAGIGDFDGDGSADILWRNRATGDNAVWGGGDPAHSVPVLAVADQNWKVAGVGDFDADGRSDILWRNASTGANAIWRGGDAANPQTVSDVADTHWMVAGIGDFNGDGTSDILWRNGATGDNAIWRGGDSSQPQAVATIADTHWQAVGIGDFNGDGQSDILWRNSASGDNAVWNGGDVNQSLAVAAVGDMNWKVVATGDYNGDGRSDIAWRNAATGADAIWSGGDAAQSLPVASVGDLNWQLPAQTGTAAAAAPKAVDFDFDANGVSDVLWRNNGSGANAIWPAAQPGNSAGLADIPSTSWQVAGLADFDHDGKADVLWRNAGTGDNAIWLDADVNQSVAVQAVGTQWKVAGLGDFNGDGHADILWRNAASGDSAIWRNGDVAQSQAVQSVPSDWKVAGVGDFNGDGSADLLWRNTTTGDNTIWRGGDVTQGQAVATVSDLNWKVAAIADFNGDGIADIFWRNALTGDNALWRSADAAQSQAVASVGDPNWEVVGAGDYDGDGKADLLWRNAATGDDAIWRAADVAQGQAMPAVPDTSWVVPAQTHVWLHPDGTYGV